MELCDESTHTHDLIPPKLLESYTPIEELEGDPTFYYKTFKAEAVKSEDEETKANKSHDEMSYTIRALDTRGDFFKKDPDYALTLFFKEVMYLCQKNLSCYSLGVGHVLKKCKIVDVAFYKGSVAIVTDEEVDGKLQNYIDDPKILTEALSIDDMLQGLQDDLKFLNSKMKLSYINIKPEAVVWDGHQFNLTNWANTQPYNETVESEFELDDEEKDTDKMKTEKESKIQKDKATQDDYDKEEEQEISKVSYSEASKNPTRNTISDKQRYALIFLGLKIWNINITKKYFTDDLGMNEIGALIKDIIRRLGHPKLKHDATKEFLSRAKSDYEKKILEETLERISQGPNEIAYYSKNGNQIMIVNITENSDMHTLKGPQPQRNNGYYLDSPLEETLRLKIVPNSNQLISSVCGANFNTSFTVFDYSCYGREPKQVFHEFSPTGKIYDISSSKATNMTALLSIKNKVMYHLYDSSDWHCMRKVPWNSLLRGIGITGLDFSSDGTTLAAIDDTGVLIFNKISNDKPILKMYLQQKVGGSGLNLCRWSPSEPKIAVTCLTGNAKSKLVFLDVIKQEKIFSLPFEGQISDIDWHEKSPLLALGLQNKGGKGSVQVVGIKSKCVVVTLEGHSVDALKWASNENHLLGVLRGSHISFMNVLKAESELFTSDGSRSICFLERQRFGSV